MATLCLIGAMICFGIVFGASIFDYNIKINLNALGLLLFALSFFL